MAALSRQRSQGGDREPGVYLRDAGACQAVSQRQPGSKSPIFSAGPHRRRLPDIDPADRSRSYQQRPGAKGKHGGKHGRKTRAENTRENTENTEGKTRENTG